MNEVTKYMNITNHISAPTTFSISNKVYSKLTAEQQDILKEAAKRASEYGLKLTQENDNVAREKLKKSMEIVNTDVISMKNKIDYSSFDCMKSAEAKKIFDLVQRDSKK
jgi:TRAP-type C4-dicarboxylate transport system substrate-binding protein